MDVQDKINILVAKNEDLINSALTINKDYICEETQAVSLEIVEMLSGAESIEIDDWNIDLTITVN
jgi:isoleucyl-tRNA synthetase